MRVWERAKIKKDEQENNIKIAKLREQFMKRKIQKQENEYNGYVRMFEKYQKKYNDNYYERENKKRKASRYVRIKGRRASEGAYGFKVIHP